MISRISRGLTSMALRQSNSFGFATSEGAEFLDMVEKYFDKAGKHTKIRPDILNFYKKADNVVKFNLTLIRGIFHIIKTMSPWRSFRLTDVSIRHISYPPKEALDMQRMWISPK
jgi:hypothetical protein